MSGRTAGTDDVTDMRPKNQDVALIRALALAYEMRDQDHDARPNARAVERACDELLRESGGQSLRDWAEENVRPAPVNVEADDVVGCTLSETLSAVPVAPTDLGEDDGRIDPPSVSTMPTRSGVVAVAGGASLLAIAVALLAVGLGAIAAVLLYNGTNTNDISDAVGGAEVVAETTPPEVAARPNSGLGLENGAEADPEGDGEAALGAEEGADPEGANGEDVADLEGTGAEGSDAEGSDAEGSAVVASSPAEPAPVARAASPSKPKAEPPPAPTAKTYPVTFTSVPLGATVFIDGQKAGTAPLAGFGLTAGSHEIQMDLNGVKSSTTIRVGRRAPTRHVWRAEDASWEANL